MPNQMTEELRDAARQMAAMRKRTRRHCAVCGTRIEGVATRRYCSDTCRVKAHYRRQQGESPIPQPTDDNLLVDLALEMTGDDPQQAAEVLLPLEREMTYLRQVSEEETWSASNYRLPSGKPISDATREEVVAAAEQMERRSQVYFIMAERLESLAKAMPDRKVRRRG